MLNNEDSEAEPDAPIVFPNDTEHDKAVFAKVAESHPGVIRTISLLITELSDLNDLAPDLRRALGNHLRRVGDTVTRHAD